MDFFLKSKLTNTYTFTFKKKKQLRMIKTISSLSHTGGVSASNHHRRSRKAISPNKVTKVHKLLPKPTLFAADQPPLFIHKKFGYCRRPDASQMFVDRGGEAAPQTVDPHVVSSTPQTTGQTFRICYNAYAGVDNQVFLQQPVCWAVKNTTEFVARNLKTYRECSGLVRFTDAELFEYELFLAGHRFHQDLGSFLPKLEALTELRECVALDNFFDQIAEYKYTGPEKSTKLLTIYDGYRAGKCNYEGTCTIPKNVGFTVQNGEYFDFTKIYPNVFRCATSLNYAGGKGRCKQTQGFKMILAETSHNVDTKSDAIRFESVLSTQDCREKHSLLYTLSVISKNFCKLANLAPHENSNPSRGGVGGDNISTIISSLNTITNAANPTFDKTLKPTINDSRQHHSGHYSVKYGDQPIHNSGQNMTPTFSDYPDTLSTEERRALCSHDDIIYKKRFYTKDIAELPNIVKIFLIDKHYKQLVVGKLFKDRSQSPSTNNGAGSPNNKIPRPALSSSRKG